MGGGRRVAGRETRSERRGNAGGGRSLAGRKGLAGELLVGGDVTAGDLDDELRRHGRDGSLSAIALVDEPFAQELLVEVLRLLPGRDLVVVGVGDPVAAAIRRVDLVDEHEPSVQQTKLVLGVHEDETALAGHFLPALEQGNGDALHFRPQAGDNQPARHHLVRRQAFVVLSLLGFGRRGDDWLRQGVIFLEARRQLQAVGPGHTLAVQCPQTGARDARDVAADDDFDRQGGGLVHEHDVGVRHGHDVVGDQIGRLLEPPGSELVEHLPLVGDHAQHPVESTDAVGRDQQTTVAEVVDIADFALVLGAEAGQVNRIEGVGNGGNKLSV